MNDSQLKHDFINNSLRIEVINRMISESLQNDQEVDSKYIEDLKTFLKDQLVYLEKF